MFVENNSKQPTLFPLPHEISIALRYIHHFRHHHRSRRRRILRFPWFWRQWFSWRSRQRTCRFPWFIRFLRFPWSLRSRRQWLSWRRRQRTRRSHRRSFLSRNSRQRFPRFPRSLGSFRSLRSLRPLRSLRSLRLGGFSGSLGLVGSESNEIFIGFLQRGGGATRPRDALHQILYIPDPPHTHHPAAPAFPRSSVP